MSITAVQRKWLDDLGHIVGNAPPRKAPPELESDDSDGFGDAVGFPTFPGIDIDVKVKSIVSEITIQNDSSATLRLVNGSQKLDRPRLSRFDPGPDVEIPPGREACVQGHQREFDRGQRHAARQYQRGSQL